MTNNIREVFYLSDGTGLTIESLGNSLLSQFNKHKFKIVNIPFIDTNSKAIKVQHKINESYTKSKIKPLIFYTIVNKDILKIINNSNGFFIDFFNPYLKLLEDELNQKPLNISGKARSMGSYSDYKLRIDALNYAIDNDDGITTDYKNADIIILGVSRSGKTPVCLYLSLQYKINVANYPLVDDDLKNPILPSFLDKYRNKLFGLSINPVRLSQIRFERRQKGKYADIEQCKFEINQVEKMYKNERIKYLNTSNVSIEEMAVKILQLKKII